MQKVLEVDSANDSCSSSKSNIKHVLPSMKIEMDETGECFSSSATGKEDTPEYLSEKDFCISILRGHGCLGGAWQTRTHVSDEYVETSYGDKCCQSSKICVHSETTVLMPVCHH